MPVYLILLVGAGILGIIGVAAAVIYWNKIVRWVGSSILPWFDTHLPTIAPSVREAFSKIDNAVTSSRKVIIAAWQKLRQHIPIIEVEFERTGNKWSMRTTAYIAKKPEQYKPTITKNTTTQEISWDDLPQYAREAFLKSGKTYHKYNFTEIRDQEILEMTQ